MTTRPLFWKRLGHPHRLGAAAVLLAAALAAVGLTVADGDFLARASSLVAGVVFGVALQRGELSLVRAWRDLIVLKDAGQLLGFLAALFVAATLTLGTLAALAAVPPADARIGPVHWLLPIAGFVFGIGSVIARGGVMVHMRRLGEGSLVAVPALLATFVGFVAGITIWPWTWAHAIGNAPTPWAPAWFGMAGTLALQTLLLAALAAALWRYRPRDDDDGPKSFLRRALIDPWPAWAAGGLLGALVAASYAAGEPLGLIAECATIARWFATALGLAPVDLPGLDEGVGGLSAPLEAFGVTQHVVILFGFMAGAFAAALASGRFRFAGFTLREGAEMVVGGLLLGVSAMTALGAITGEAIAGVAVGALSGWIFLISASVGIVTALKLDRRSAMMSVVPPPSA
ncbi:YeeE/YedE family protein [Chelatococcus sambhunathii]|uniref:YeeE/YedE family protein n=1 Tax=Chelatococcus sambhunathii TaxID=363953 RepID=A0ABU1DAG5_9HYPH|nr:YeeE/YedE thiosulfate transporter family protein [Chelatococcus sambhunathii]MDR4305118.1 YeeE/YedE family protein [Chelatococcus sambhunathii]